MCVPKETRSVVPSGPTLAALLAENEYAGLPYEPAMQFKDIAAALGIKTSHAQYIYRRAIGKLRADPRMLDALALAAACAACKREMRPRVSRHYVANIRPQPISELPEVAL